jgi:hypothetical protein
MTFLQGKKTYIIAALIGLLAAANSLGYVDQQTFETLTVLLTGGGLATLRAGVSTPPQD